MKPIKGFKDYLVSKDGKIFSNKSNKFLKLVPIKGYLHVELFANKKGNMKRVHRLVAETYIPNPKNLPIVMHLDDNRKNNIVTNLRWGTPQDNISDMVNKNRQSKGSKRYNAKLTEKDVLKIRSMEGKLKDIAAIFNIDFTTVSDIKRRKSWKHI